MVKSLHTLNKSSFKKKRTIFILLPHQSKKKVKEPYKRHYMHTSRHKRGLNKLVYHRQNIYNAIDSLYRFTHTLIFVLRICSAVATVCKAVIKPCVTTQRPMQYAYTYIFYEYIAAFCTRKDLFIFYL